MKNPMTTSNTSTTNDRFRRLAAAAVVAAATLLGAGGVAAQEQPAVRPGATQGASGATPIEGKDSKLALMVNRSLVVTTKLPYKTVNVANPDVVDFNRVDDYQILLTAKRPGTTQLMIWDVGGGTQIGRAHV